MSATNLDRFHSAQSQSFGGYRAALAELRAGRKTGHWIWYIFPQLRGLGRSSTSETYGIAGAAEAEAYVRDPILGERLAEVTRALESHVCAPSTAPAAAPKSLDAVLGGIDAMKVVSCLTLFLEVTRRLGSAPGPWVAAFRESAERVLKAAAREGRKPCAFTLNQLATRGDR